MSEKTIAAISTPAGKGGVSMIRISGKDALSIAGKIFYPASGRSLSSYPQSRAVYGKIFSYEDHDSPAKIIDDGIATVFYAPHSFSGEDTVEISCHGGILITRNVLEAIFSAGAIPAGPGEFTKRAFINGKIALSQAQAVIDTINAENEEQLSLARSHLDGKLSDELTDIAGILTRVLSQCYVLCDYPDEDLSEIGNEEMACILQNCNERLTRLLATYKQGHAVAKGIQTVIVGRPNVGKSSLLNSLLGYDRAIVTDIPGTTRDTVEENMYVGKIMLRLCDTAGIRKREDSDSVEYIGIGRSIDKLKNAELVIAVFDSSQCLQTEDKDIIEILKNVTSPKIAVLNKSDLNAKTGPSQLDYADFCLIESVCASNGSGVEKLKSDIENLFYSAKIDYSLTPVLSDAWQKASVENALECIARASNALINGTPADIAGLDIERAVAFISESDGKKVSDEIVRGIFASFCVGK